MNIFLGILGTIISLIIVELTILYLFKKHPKVIYEYFREEAMIILKNFKDDVR